MAQMERSHHGLLLRRSDPAKDRMRVHGLREIHRIIAELPSIQRILRRGHTCLNGNGPDRRWIVARDHLDSDILLKEVANRLRRVRPQPLVNDDKRDRVHLSGTPIDIRSSTSAAREEDDARPLGGQLLGADPNLRVGIAEDHLGCAEKPTPMVAERRRRPLARAGECHAVHERPSWVRIGLGHGLDRRVGGFLCRAECREGSLGVGVRVKEHNVGDRHAGLGQGARLINADRVDAGEHLDRRKILDQHLPLGQAHHGHRHGDACQQHQSLGDHRDDAPDRAADSVVDGLVCTQLRDQQEQSDRRNHEGCESDELCDVIAKFRARRLELLGLCGQPGGKGIPSDTSSDVQPGSGDHEGSGHRFVPHGLVDRISLTCQETLIDLQAISLDDCAIHDELITGSHNDDVVEHDLRRTHIYVLTIAPHQRSGLSDDREFGQGSARSVLLDDADEGIRNDDEAEERVLEGCDKPHHHPHGTDECVEPGQCVGPDDAAQASTARIRRIIRLAQRHSLRHLGRSQARHDICRTHDFRPSSRRRMTPSRRAHGPISNEEMSRRSMADSATIAPASN